MAEKLRAMMQKQQGGRSSFTMTGQYAGSVMREDGPMGSREFVMYDSPNGEQVKVYGNWNEYAAGRDEEGRDMIADEDYPIIQNEAGEFVLDEVRHNENMDTAYERQPVERMARETEMESTQGASKIENLLEKLQDARGPRPRFQEGGAMPDDKVVKMKKQIIRMMEGGASDKEIMMMINKSPLGKQYEFNWDNVEMKVEAYPMEDDRFGPKDKGGQRGDMFAYGGLMSKLKKYNHGGSTGPSAPEWILNDPMFQNILYVGKAKDDYVRKVAGQGADFRYDAKGVKFYGYDDDGLYFEDRNGNLFQAKRRVSVSEDPNADYMDMFDHIQQKHGGQFSDEHAMTQEGAAGSDREAFGPSDTKGLLHNLNMVRSRRGGRDGEIISGPSQEERERAARADRQATNYGMKTARSYRRGGKVTAKGPKTAGPFQGPFGSHGSSATEDLLERLNDYKRRRR